MDLENFDGMKWKLEGRKDALWECVGCCRMDACEEVTVCTAVPVHESHIENFYQISTKNFFWWNLWWEISWILSDSLSLMNFMRTLVNLTFVGFTRIWWQNVFDCSEHSSLRISHLKMILVAGKRISVLVLDLWTTGYDWKVCNCLAKARRPSCREL